MTFKKKVKDVEKEIMDGSPVAEQSSVVANPLNQKLNENMVKHGEYEAHIVKDYDGVVDVFYLNNYDSNYEYRFLRGEDKNLSLKTSNALLAKGGWMICPKVHLLRIGMKERELSPDGLCRRGDQVLAFMPKELYAEKQALKVKRANEPMGAIKRLLNKGDESVGKSIHRSLRGIQHAEDLGMGKRDHTEM